MANPAARDLVFIGDVHLDRDDPDLDAFLSFLDRLGETSSRIVLIGDLFNLWIGRRELEQPHQTAVLESLVRLRKRGVVVRYLEGNRDYRIGPCHAGGALDEASEAGLVERFGGHSVLAIHGDLTNPADRQYRLWRRVSRAAIVWKLFNLLPRDSRLRFAGSLEARMRASNPSFKREFPETAVRAYGRSFLEAGHDVVVLGHFHVEKDLAVVAPGRPGRVLVLPEWKGSRRYLRLTPEGRIGFVDA